MWFSKSCESTKLIKIFEKFEESSKKIIVFLFKKRIVLNKSSSLQAKLFQGFPQVSTAFSSIQSEPHSNFNKFLQFAVTPATLLSAKTNYPCFI